MSIESGATPHDTVENQYVSYCHASLGMESSTDRIDDQDASGIDDDVATWVQ
jgi:hypothetical protein